MQYRILSNFAFVIILSFIITKEARSSRRRRKRRKRRRRKKGRRRRADTWFTISVPSEIINTLAIGCRWEDETTR